MIVALTGATGFVGRAITAALRAEGHRVRALVRRDVTLPGVETVRAPLVPGEALTRAVDGAEVLVHCAGGGRAVTRADFLANNLATTEALLGALDAAEHPPRRFVLISSVTAGGPDGNTPAACASDVCGARSEYGESKWLAERAVHARGPALERVVLRVPAVYGPGDDRMEPLVRAALRGVVPMPLPDQPLSMIDVDDCARAVALLVAAPIAPSTTYWVEDGETYTPRGMAEAIAAHAGRRVRILPVPRPLLTLVARAAEWNARRTDTPAFLTRDKLRDARAPAWRCSAATLRHDTGFTPRHTFPARLPDILAALDAR